MHGEITSADKAGMIEVALIVLGVGVIFSLAGAVLSLLSFGVMFWG